MSNWEAFGLGRGMKTHHDSVQVIPVLFGEDVELIRLDLGIRLGLRLGLDLRPGFQLDPTRFAKVGSHVGDLPVGIANELRVGLRKEKMVEACACLFWGEERTRELEEFSLAKQLAIKWLAAKIGSLLTMLCSRHTNERIPTRIVIFAHGLRLTVEKLSLQQVWLCTGWCPAQPWARARWVADGICV